MDPRYTFAHSDALLSPSLLIYRDLVLQNLTRMLEISGGPGRLRPHVKTHKMAAIVRIENELGVTKHKCATIAEAEMLAAAGAADVLLSYPLVGPNVARFLKLIGQYGHTRFRAIVDHPDSARNLSREAVKAGHTVPVLVDLEVGMGRTGIEPNAPAAGLYALIAELPHLEPDGLHAYDGHINQTELEARRQSALRTEELMLGLRDRLIRDGLPAPRLVLGGTPSFSFHAALNEPGVECSPGTTVLHDHGYSTKFPDLPFVPAALLLTRVVSRPRAGRVCLDLGHKAVAADPVGARVHLIDMPEPKFVGQSEEHLVVESPAADRYAIGTLFLGIPTHICPTVALHRRAYVIAGGRMVEEWEVTARDRVIGI